MSFSSSLRITEIDDFITPSLECIKPIQPASTASQSVKFDQSSSSFSQLAPSSPDSLGPARITLSDCLACSGCVTSAETVLVNAQSVDRLIEFLTDSSKTFVYSVSPQSLASLAAHFHLDLVSTAERLTTFLKLHCRAHYVFDAGNGSGISLIEQRNEFLTRYRQAKSVHSGRDQLPLLTSECPGWICYAEKTQPDCLPYISTVRSPQQIIGKVVKQYLGLKNVVHVCIMPCYDKKLEASRPEFDGDVDMVLATSELLSYIKERTDSLSNIHPGDLDDNRILGVEDTHHVVHLDDLGASGGYSEHVFRYACRELFNVDVSSPLIYKQVGRNPDFRETTLEVNGQVVLRFAAAYGFRNIQNLVRKIKSGSCPYHFVEVMACPSGCLNGGGQIQSAESGIKAQRVLLDQVSSIFRQAESHDPTVGPVPTRFYDDWIGSVPGSEQACSVVHTTYRAIEKNPELGMLEKW